MSDTIFIDLYLSFYLFIYNLWILELKNLPLIHHILMSIHLLKIHCLKFLQLSLRLRVQVSHSQMLQRCRNHVDLYNSKFMFYDMFKIMLPWQIIIQINVIGFFDQTKSNNSTKTDSFILENDQLYNYKHKKY